MGKAQQHDSVVGAEITAGDVGEHVIAGFYQTGTEDNDPEQELDPWVAHTILDGIQHGVPKGLPRCECDLLYNT